MNYSNNIYRKHRKPIETIKLGDWLDVLIPGRVGIQLQIRFPNLHLQPWSLYWGHLYLPFFPLARHGLYPPPHTHKPILAVDQLIWSNFHGFLFVYFECSVTSGSWDMDQPPQFCFSLRMQMIFTSFRTFTVNLWDFISWIIIYSAENCPDLWKSSSEIPFTCILDYLVWRLEAGRTLSSPSRFFFSTLCWSNTLKTQVVTLRGGIMRWELPKEGRLLIQLVCHY